MAPSDRSTTSTVSRLPRAFESQILGGCNDPNVRDEQMALLLSHNVPEANYNSDAVVSLAPKLHPGTREGVLKAINAWIMVPKNYPSVTARPLGWLFGSNGTGKTCIQREFAVRLHRDRRLLASFFFLPRHALQSNSDPRVDKTMIRFIATLASQIATNIPGLWQFVSSEIQEEPGIFSSGRSVQDQMECLVFRPLQRFLQYSQRRYWWRRLKASLRGTWPEKLEECIAFRELHAEWWQRSIVVVDGLEECEGAMEQRRIVGLMEWASMHPNFPMRFFISSPQEDRNIRKLFQNIWGICKAIGIEAYDAGEEIFSYLSDELAKIRNTHPMFAPIEAPQDPSSGEGAGNPGWPSRRIVDLLVAKSYNRFLYPSIIVRILQNPRRSPVESLDRLMASIPVGNTANIEQPFAELDALHAAIFRQPELDFDVVQRLMHAILFSGRGFEAIFELEEYLGVGPGSASIVLENLRPLIDVEGPIRFHHSYTRNYLLSKDRSGDLFQCR